MAEPVSVPVDASARNFLFFLSCQPLGQQGRWAGACLCLQFLLRCPPSQPCLLPPARNLALSYSDHYDILAYFAFCFFGWQLLDASIFNLRLPPHTHDQPQITTDHTPAHDTPPRRRLLLDPTTSFTWLARSGVQPITQPSQSGSLRPGVSSSLSKSWAIFFCQPAWSARRLSGQLSIICGRQTQIYYSCASFGLIARPDRLLTSSRRTLPPVTRCSALAATTSRPAAICDVNQGHPGISKPPARLPCGSPSSGPPSGPRPSPGFVSRLAQWSPRLPLSPPLSPILASFRPLTVT